MSGLLADPAFWTAVALGIFVIVLLIANVHGTMAKGLDQRAAGIKSEIQGAERLRTEAVGLLARHRAQEAQAATEAQGIVAEARAEVQRLAREGRDDLAKLIERRRRQAEEKISRAEAEAVADIRNYAAKVSIAAARRFIRERMDGARGSRIVDAAIAELPARLKGRG
jgi:F-type H+-transporting ATPase subunit b